MSNFEILCVTMHQHDFAKIKEMNIHSDVVFANQCDRTAYEEIEFDGHKAKMISTQTRGVGVNRNLALMYASAEFCLFADDDVKYKDDVEELVTKEFAAHPVADVFIFHLETDDPVRKQIRYPKTRKSPRWGRNPWAGFRIAFRRSAVLKANLWFSTLFGGGCLFPSGEDSIWLKDARRKGLTLYVSKETIGTVSFATSTWYTGVDEKFFYGKGVGYRAIYPKSFYVRFLYFSLPKRKSDLSFFQRMRWMRNGAKGYEKMLSFEEFKKICHKD